MAQDALITMLAHLIREGKPINPPRCPKGRKIRMIDLPVMVSVKTALYIAFRESGMTKAELARKLDIPRANVDRLFDFRHQSRMDQMEAAFRAVGKELTIGVRDAA
jgi:antitoxin HicB